MPTQFVKRAAGWTAGYLGKVLRPRRELCGVLLYHRTYDDRLKSKPSWNVSPTKMRAQLRGLKDRGVRFVSVEEMVAMLRAAEPLPDRCVAVTFDDVYENNFADAVPILSDLEIPPRTKASI